MNKIMKKEISLWQIKSTKNKSLPTDLVITNEMIEEIRKMTESFKNKKENVFKKKCCFCN